MRHALLALLAGGPAHGYELKQAFERQFGAIWPPVNIGQVYMTLQRLERDGLIAGQAVAQRDRPNKMVYELTGAGKEELLTWLVTPAGPARLRATQSSASCLPRPRAWPTRTPFSRRSARGICRHCEI
jgi:DNA-binding PadR family transcriptional regulator